jgi:hypothetical protein
MIKIRKTNAQADYKRLIEMSDIEFSMFGIALIQTDMEGKIPAGSTFWAMINEVIEIRRKVAAGDTVVYL